MKRKLILFFFCLVSFYVNGQQSPAVIDSFKAQLAKANSSEQKIEILAKLSMTLMNTNIAEADKYGTLMNQEAELSRNRKLIIKALLSNGLRYSVFVGNKDFLQKAVAFYTKALQVARANKLEKETAESLLALATVYTSIPDLDKSMSYTTQAFAIVSNLNNDSLKVAAYYSYGAVYQLKKERILALRNYLNALRIAEEINNPTLMRSCYAILSQFYADIREYDKAIDFFQKASAQLPLIKAENIEYNIVVDLFMMGDLYTRKKDFDMAVYYYEKSIKKADSLKYQPLKMPGYSGILRQYIQAKQPQKALAYLNNSADLKQFITNFGAAHVIDNSYAAIYTQMGKYDSAQYYFAKASAGFEKTSTPVSKLSFYQQYADFYTKSGNRPKAIEYYNKAMALADETKDIEWQQRIAKELDTVYALEGNFEKSRLYSNLYHKHKDSLQKLGEEKDLLQMELADEQQRQERIKREEAEALRKKHNVQYMGITIAIAIVFLLLILMGIFKVSETTIKIIGFFAFIFLFEFIILLADAKIHHWTHGEPLPILGIKIILIAMLLPLHHWLEHKVVSYLASRRLITPSGKSFWQRFVNKPKSSAS